MINDEIEGKTSKILPINNLLKRELLLRSFNYIPVIDRENSVSLVYSQPDNF